MAGKVALISDFDDTLVNTKSNIHIIKADGTKLTLTPAEYAVYNADDTDKFDFSEFDKLIDPTPIPRYVRLMKKAIKDERVSKVVVLTARGHAGPVKQFLRSVGVNGGVKIVTLNSADPVKKKEYIERQIQKGYTRIAFMDDSPRNVAAAKELHAKYPNATLVVHHVNRDVTTGARDTRTTKKEKASDTATRTAKLKRDVSAVTIMNPVTKRTIKLRSALSYGKDSPVYSLAISKLKQLQRA